VRLTSLLNNRIILRVMVRGRRRDPVLEMETQFIPEEERVERAARHVAAGNRLAESPDCLYAAAAQYRAAIALLKPLKVRPAVYLEAYQKEKDVAKRLEMRYQELKTKVNQAATREDVAGQLLYFQQILDLIPDENDPIHQRTVFFRTAVFKEAQKKKRRW